MPVRRFNVLLTVDREHGSEHWTNQLAQLLQPQGVHTYVARTGRQVAELVRQTPIHAAVLDMNLPLGEDSGDWSSGGMWALELIRRLPDRPPVVLLRSPAAMRRQAERILADALRLGAFSVLDKPVGVEDVLAVFRRLVDRQYRGRWPSED
ncbi:MAG: hypothetical protein JJU36_08075 [Phycisphaeraceae bacterium]|nr:hypothetical protein [Phycisphaeraceae bacterium]